MILIKFLQNLFFVFYNNLKSIYLLSKTSLLNPTCDFQSQSHIVNCTFGRFVKIFDHTKIFNAQIDSYTYIQTNSRIFNCNIGKFCSIAASVSISPGTHDLDKVSTHPAFYETLSPLPKVFAKNNKLKKTDKVIIRNDVWIGEKVIILDGIQIGNGAVIASGAVVVKNVVPYSVVGGVPAKHIKYRFDDPTIALLEKSEWWNYTDEWFEKKAHLMLDIDKFIDYLNAK